MCRNISPNDDPHWNGVVHVKRRENKNELLAAKHAIVAININICEFTHIYIYIV